MTPERSSEELLYPLGSLYPHVVALQLQADENPWTQASNFSGHHDISYWAEISSHGPAEDYSRPRPSTSRRYSGECFLFQEAIWPVRSANPRLPCRLHSSKVCFENTTIPQPRRDAPPPATGMIQPQPRFQSRERILLYTNRLLFLSPVSIINISDIAFLLMFLWSTDGHPSVIHIPHGVSAVSLSRCKRNTLLSTFLLSSARHAFWRFPPSRDISTVFLISFLFFYLMFTYSHGWISG